MNFAPQSKAHHGTTTMSSTYEHAIAAHPPLLAAAFDPVSICEVIRRHHEALLLFLRRRLAVPEDALDAAQETYLRMLRYEGSRAIESPGSMLFRIAANVAADQGRAALTRRSADHLALDDVELASEAPSTERAIAGEQDLKMLFAAIDGLPPRCRQVFLLSRVEGKTYPEIARHCGISVKMVEKHVSHALLACSAKLGNVRNAAAH
jgi:RNA polymerase sigma factor (sigma-70 family)